LVWLLRDSISLAQLAAREQQFRRTIAREPFRSTWIALAICFVMSLVPGTSGKSIIIGWFFGFWRGVFIAESGLVLAAMLSFALSRYVFRAAAEHYLQHYLKRLNTALERDGAFYLVTLRMFHVPFTLINYGAGASRVPAWTFAWTTAVGLLPGTIVFVFLGTQLPTLHDLAAHGARQLQSPTLLFAMLAMGLVPLAVRWMINALRRTFVNPNYS